MARSRYEGVPENDGGVSRPALSFSIGSEQFINLIVTLLVEAPITRQVKVWTVYALQRNWLSRAPSSVSAPERN
jgi:hypothetical protein